MRSTKNRFFLLFAALFLALTLACWFPRPQGRVPHSARRKLAQKAGADSQKLHRRRLCLLL